MTKVHNMPVLIGTPTYNRANGYLREALESALAQDYEPLEIIVSDNCSTDDTETFVKSYNDPGIWYLRPKISEYRMARAAGCLQPCRGRCENRRIDRHSTQQNPSKNASKKKLGMRYRKVGSVPSGADRERQEEFKKTLEPRIEQCNKP